MTLPVSNCSKMKSQYSSGTAPNKYGQEIKGAENVLHKTCSCPAQGNEQSTLEDSTLEAELLEVEKELVAAEEELWRLDKMRKDAELTSEADVGIHFDTTNADKTRPFVVKSCFDDVLKDLINNDCKTNIKKIRNLPNPICKECEIDEDEKDDDSTCDNADCQGKRKSNRSSGKNIRTTKALYKSPNEIEDEIDQDEDDDDSTCDNADCQGKRKSNCSSEKNKSTTKPLHKSPNELKDKIDQDEDDDDSTCDNADCQGKRKSNRSSEKNIRTTKPLHKSPNELKDACPCDLKNKKNLDSDNETCPTVNQLNKNGKIKESRENYNLTPGDLLKFACPCKPPHTGRPLIIPNASNKYKTPQMLPKRTSRKIQRCPRKKPYKLKTRDNSVDGVIKSENKCVITDCKKDEDPCLQFNNINNQTSTGSINQSIIPGVDKETCCTWTPKTPELCKAVKFYKNKEEQLEEVILDLKDYIKQNTKKILKTFDTGVIKSYSEDYLPCDDACDCDCHEQLFFEIKSFMDEDLSEYQRSEEDAQAKNLKNNLSNIKKLKESVEKLRKDECLRNIQKQSESNKYIQCTECLNEDVQTNKSREVFNTKSRSHVSSIEKTNQEEDYQCNKCWTKDNTQIDLNTKSRNISKDKIKRSTENVNNDEIYECIECLIEDLQSIKGMREEALAEKSNVDNNKLEDKIKKVNDPQSVKTEASDIIKKRDTTPIPDDTYNCIECWEEDAPINKSKKESSKILNQPDQIRKEIKQGALNTKTQNGSEYFECTRCLKEETREVAKINDANIRKSLAAKNDKGYECTECLIEDLEHTIKNLKDYVQLAKSLQKVNTNTSQSKLNESKKYNFEYTTKDDELYECLECYDEEIKSPEPQKSVSSPKALKTEIKENKTSQKDLETSHKDSQAIASKEASQNVRPGETINSKVEFVVEKPVDNKSQKTTQLVSQDDTEYICTECLEENPQYLQESFQEPKPKPTERSNADVSQKHAEPSFTDKNNLHKNDTDSKIKPESIEENDKEYCKYPFDDLQAEKVHQANKVEKIRTPKENEFTCKECMEDLIAIEELRQAVLANREAKAAEQAIKKSNDASSYIECAVCKAKVIELKKEFYEYEKDNYINNKPRQIDENSQCRYENECNLCMKEDISPRLSQTKIKEKISSEYDHCKNICIEEDLPAPSKNKLNEQKKIGLDECRKLCLQENLPPPSEKKEKDEKPLGNEYDEYKKLCIEEKQPVTAQIDVKDVEYDYTECNKQCKDVKQPVTAQIDIKDVEYEYTECNKQCKDVKQPVTAQIDVKDVEYEYTECNKQCKDFVAIKKNPKDVIVNDEKGTKKYQNKKGKMKDGDDILVCTKCSNDDENNNINISPTHQKATSSTSADLQSSICKVKNECNECTIEDIKVINIQDEIETENKKPACPECATDNKRTQSKKPVVSSGKEMNKKATEYDLYECNDCSDTIKVKKGPSRIINLNENNDTRNETTVGADKKTYDDDEKKETKLENSEKKPDNNREYKIDNSSKTSSYVGECDGCLTDEVTNSGQTTNNNTITYEYFECDKCNEVVQVKKESEKPISSNNSAKNDLPKRSAAVGVKKTSNGKEVFICSTCAKNNDDCRSNENYECLTCLTSGVRCSNIYTNTTKSDPIRSRSCRTQRNTEIVKSATNIRSTNSKINFDKPCLRCSKNNEIQRDTQSMTSGSDTKSYTSTTEHVRKCLRCSNTLIPKRETSSLKNCQIQRDTQSNKSRSDIKEFKSSKGYDKKCPDCGSSLVSKKDTSQFKSCHTREDSQFSNSRSFTNRIISYKNYQKKCQVCGSTSVRRRNKSFKSDTRSIQIGNDTRSITSIGDYDKKCLVCGKKMMNKREHNLIEKSQKEDQSVANYRNNLSYIDSNATKVNVSKSSMISEKTTNNDVLNNKPETRENTGTTVNVKDGSENSTSSRNRNADSERRNMNHREQDEDTSYSIASANDQDTSEGIGTKDLQQSKSPSQNIQDYKERREWKRK